MLEPRLMFFFSDLNFAVKVLGIYGLKTEKVNFPGYMNMRDAIAHLHHSLELGSDPELQEAEIICAQEHLRRAAVEPFQEMFESKYSATLQSYKDYRENCIHHEELLGYKGMFDHERIRESFRGFRKDLLNYRKGKASHGWKERVFHLIDRCDEVDKLAELVQSCHDTYNARRP